MSHGHDLNGLTGGFVCRRGSVLGGPAPRREFGNPAIGPVVDELGEAVEARELDASARVPLQVPAAEWSVGADAGAVPVRGFRSP